MDISELIKGFEPVSLCDWPSKVSCVLFLGGCNFRCPTCHNKSIAFYPQKVPSIPKQDIFDYLQRKRNWLDGVVVSGGEPTCAPGLDRLLVEIKDLGFLVKLDTNGSNPYIIEDYINRGIVDVFAVDVKGPFEKYPILTGNKITATQVEKNFEKIFSQAKLYPSKFIFRLTMVPFLTQQDIKTTMNYLPQGFELKLQEYKESPLL